MSDRKEPFFIGWAKPPAALRPFLFGVAALFLAVFGVSAYVASATQSDPGEGTFRWDWGGQTITGRLEAKPYPVLFVTQSERFEPGTPILLGGPGKRGVMDRAAPLDGQSVTAQGIMLTRGDHMMLQVAGREDALRPAESDALTEPPRTEPLGRWRLTGEICDGKCYSGAMRPGTGLAHKACANLCLIGGQPPLFVTSEPLDGHTVFLMGDQRGGPVHDAVLDDTGVRVSLEADVEVRGGLPVALIDPHTVAPAP